MTVPSGISLSSPPVPHDTSRLVGFVHRTDPVRSPVSYRPSCDGKFERNGASRLAGSGDGWGIARHRARTCNKQETVFVANGSTSKPATDEATQPPPATSAQRWTTDMAMGSLSAVSCGGVGCRSLGGGERRGKRELL